MARRISRDGDDHTIGLRFHNCSSRMPIHKVSFIALQRLFDEFDRSFYRCPECHWSGRGRELAAMENDGSESYAFDTEAETWYACPKCECEIAIDRPFMRLVESSVSPEREAASDTGKGEAQPVKLVLV